jgi:VWFA-related protein
VAISLMLDISGSMIRTLPNVRRAAETLIDRFIAGDRVNVGTFSSEITYGSRFTANRSRILTAIEEAMVGGDLLCDPPSRPRNTIPRPVMGGTWMWDAIECGIRVLGNDGEAFRRVLLLVTDGKTNGGYAKPSTAMQLAKREGVLIYAVGLLGTHGRDGELLRDLTVETGGAYLPLEEKDDFVPPFQRIAAELHGQYILAFETAPGASGRLTVKVSNPALSVRSRKGYVVPAR